MAAYCFIHQLHHSRPAGEATDKGLFICRRVSSTHCSAEGCGILATFGYPGHKPERCKAHVLDGMVRINTHTNLKQGSHLVCICNLYVRCILDGAESHVR